MGKVYRPLLGEVTPLEIVSYLNGLLKTTLPVYKYKWYLTPRVTGDLYICLTIELTAVAQELFDAKFAPLLEDSHYVNQVGCLSIQIPSNDFEALVSKINGETPPIKLTPSPAAPSDAKTAAHQFPALSQQPQISYNIWGNVASEVEDDASFFLQNLFSPGHS